MEELPWIDEIEQVFDNKRYTHMQQRSFRSDRFVKMAGKVDGFSGTCQVCKEFKEEMITITKQLKDEGNFQEITFEKYLFLFRKLSDHLKSFHLLVSPNYYSSKYSFIGMAAGLVLCLLIWLFIGKPEEMILDSKLVIMITGFAGLAIGRFAGLKKDKRITNLNKRIY
ncbi:MAG: hypothetical protein DRI73_00515 [Bacteroidetes bacterium]|nr:MAG: hypothetical protein DRI73_00515 [Bacteroidota bacterium]